MVDEDTRVRGTCRAASQAGGAGIGLRGIAIMIGHSLYLPCQPVGTTYAWPTLSAAVTTQKAKLWAELLRKTTTCDAVISRSLFC